MTLMAPCVSSSRVRNGKAIGPRRLEHPLQVRIEPEYRWPTWRVVAANAFEDSGAVVQPVRRHVDRGFFPGNDPPVLPNPLALGEKRHPETPWFEVPRGLKFARNLKQAALT